MGLHYAVNCNMAKKRKNLSKITFRKIHKYTVDHSNNGNQSIFQFYRSLVNTWYYLLPTAPESIWKNAECWGAHCTDYCVYVFTLLKLSLLTMYPYLSSRTMGLCIIPAFWWCWLCSCPDTHGPHSWPGPPVWPGNPVWASPEGP